MQITKEGEDIPEIFISKKFLSTDTFFDLDEFFIISKAGFTYKDKQCNILHHSNRGIEILNNNDAFNKWEKKHKYETVNIPLFEIESHLQLIVQEHKIKRLMFLHEIVKKYF